MKTSSFKVFIILLLNIVLVLSFSEKSYSNIEELKKTHKEAFDNFKNKNFEKSVVLFEKLLKNNIESDNIRISYAYSLFILKKYVKSIEEFDKVIKNSKSNKAIDYSKKLITEIKKKNSYYINGKAYYFRNDLLRNSYQDNLISLNSINKTTSSVISDLKNKSINTYNFKDPNNIDNTINLKTINAPFWSVIAEISKQSGLGFVVSSGNPDSISMPWMNEASLKEYDVEGPVILFWQGLVKDEGFNMSTNKMEKDIFYQIRLFNDPQSKINYKAEDLNPDITLNYPNGKNIIIKADKVIQYGTNGLIWNIYPQSVVKSKNVNIKFPIKLWISDNKIKDLNLMWKNGHLIIYKQEIVFKINSIKEDDKYFYANLEYKYKDHVLEKDNKQREDILKNIRKEKRNLNNEEISILESLTGGKRVISLDNIIYLLDKENNKIPSYTINGGGSPSLGYSYEIMFEKKNNFNPYKIKFSVSTDYTPTSVDFNLKNISFE